MSTCKKKAFWLTNVSNLNVSLADLNLTIKAYSSVNLLDKRHYKYTLSQLETSAATGSIFKKSHLVAIRKLAPEKPNKNKLTSVEHGIPSRQRSIISTSEERHDELNISDEQFAAESADLLK